MEILLAHASDDVGFSTAERGRCRQEALPRELWRVGCEAERRPGMRNQSRYDGILTVGVGVVVHGRSTGGLAHDRDTRWISAEASDVVSHPLDGSSLIQQADILWFSRCAGKAEDVETIARWGMPCIS